MTNLQFPSASLVKWRDLYLAALFETDRSLIPERIKEARQAIVDRARELFNSKRDTIDEDQALDDAIYALKALQSSLAARSTAA